MKNLILIVLLLKVTSCAFVPAYRAEKVEYCEKVNGIVYCDDITVDTNYYNDCSVYDDDGCRSR